MESIYRPTGRLSTYVRMIWISKGYSPTSAKEHVLPFAACQLIINLEGIPFRHFNQGDEEQGTRYSPAVLSGIHTHPIFLDSYSRISTMGIVFRPGAITAFFGLPTNELYNQVISLADLIPADTSRLFGLLEQTTKAGQKFLAIESFLIDLLDRNFRPTPAIKLAISRIRKFNGTSSIAEIQDQTGYSQRHFSQLFKELAGLSPKRYARLCRFEHAVELIYGNNISDWTRLAHDLGYYDQSHFIRDFKAMAGLLPTHYHQSQPQQKNHIPIL